MNNFQRTQIYLEQGQIQRLKSVSQKERVPMSELIRKAIDSFLDRGLKKGTKDSLSKAVGRISLKTKTASVDHDRYLYGA